MDGEVARGGVAVLSKPEPEWGTMRHIPAAIAACPASLLAAALLALRRAQCHPGSGVAHRSGGPGCGGHRQHRQRQDAGVPAAGAGADPGGNMQPKATAMPDHHLENPEGGGLLACFAFFAVTLEAC